MANVSITMSVPAAGVSPALTGSGESVGSGSGSTVGSSTHWRRVGVDGGGGDREVHGDSSAWATIAEMDHTIEWAQ